jgi:two-component system, NarL family, sensor histidine kinase YdfH
MANFGKQATIQSMHKRLSSPGFLKQALWGEERPFFWILTVAMIVIYGSALIGSPHLRAPITLSLFTLLMIIHTGLHWISPHMGREPWRRWRVGYMVGQAALAFILNYMAGGVGILLGLYMALIGESVGMLPQVRWKATATVLYLALSAINYLMLVGWRDIIWWVAAVVPVAFFVIVYVFLYGRQAEAREEAQALSRKLEAANRQLTESAAQVEDLTRAAERQRMARELHDTLAQGLAGLILQLEAANSHLANDRPERAQAIVQQAMTRARGTLADARRAIDDLRAETAATSDLAAAVRAEADRFTAATGLPCELTLALPTPLSQPVREQALRAVTEALTNVAKHAQAAHVWVRLTGCITPAQGPGLEVEVRDDGLGFDSAAALAPGHYGLQGLRERARLTGGALEVASAPSRGTLVQLWLPIDESRASQQPGGPD